jgi:predicted PurR-regulated permease PerM
LSQIDRWRRLPRGEFFGRGKHNFIVAIATMSWLALWRVPGSSVEQFMKDDPTPPIDEPIVSAAVEPARGWLSRDRALALVLVLLTLIAVYLCYLLVHPFLSAMAWALALAIVAHPSYEWLTHRLHSKNLAAAFTVAVVALVIIAPTVVLAQQLLGQVGEGVDFVRSKVQDLSQDELVKRHPWLEPVVQWLERPNTPNDEVNRIATTVSSQLSSFVSGSLWALTELLITLYILFYFIRDHREGINWLRSLVPLSDRETDEVFNRVEDTVFATIYGSVVVALVQGIVAGLLFWAVGLPAPLLWGALVAVLALIPILGPFVIFIPAALLLALQEDWRTAIEVGSGGIVIALIGHFLYPFLVGKRLRLHPVLVFFAFLGGLAVFGAAGLILGPAVLALTEALVHVWQRRTAEGGPAEIRPAL